jgi:hypothetical protein
VLIKYLTEAFHHIVTGIMAVSRINEAVDRKASAETLAALMAPSAGLRNVDSNEAVHYQQMLYRVKAEKAQVSCYFFSVMQIVSSACSSLC